MNVNLPVQPGESKEDKALRAVASLIGACVIATTNGSHAENSLHKTTDATGGRGRAIDLASFSGPGVNTNELLKINKDILTVVPLKFIAELIYSGNGGICVKNGVVVSGAAVYGPVVMSAHHNHNHLAVVKGFTFNNPTPPGGNGMPDAIVSQGKIVNLVPTPSGKGYWIITEKGEIFAFGDAPFFGRVEWRG